MNQGLAELQNSSIKWSGHQNETMVNLCCFIYNEHTSVLHDIKLNYEKENEYT